MPASIGTGISTLHVVAGTGIGISSGTGVHRRRQAGTGTGTCNRSLVAETVPSSGAGRALF